MAQIQKNDSYTRSDPNFFDNDSIMIERAEKAGKLVAPRGHKDDRRGERLADNIKRDDDLVSWNPDLMATEFVSDGSVFFCIDSDSELGSVKDNAFPSDDYE